MKKFNKILFAVLLMVFACAPVVNAQEVKRTAIDDEIITSSVLDDIKQYGEGEYAGGGVYGISQIAQTENTVTLAWQPASGATGYLVAMYDLNNTLLNSIAVADASVVLSVNGRVKVVVIPGDANGYCTDISKYTGILAAPIPAKITGLEYKDIFGGNYNLSVFWTDADCTGFEAVCYNKKGKQVDIVDTTLYRNATFYKTNTQNVYIVKVRGYSTINGTEKLYGPESDAFYAVPQPRNMTHNSDLKQNSINLKWKKVKGASKYEIYVSKSLNGGYKKVATLKGTAKSYRITRFNGRPINLLNTYHYVKVVTYAKFGKKTVKSQKKGYVRCSVTKYYY